MVLKIRETNRVKLIRELERQQREKDRVRKRQKDDGIERERNREMMLHRE